MEFVTAIVQTPRREEHQVAIKRNLRGVIIDDDEDEEEVFDDVRETTELILVN